MASKLSRVAIVALVFVAGGNAQRRALRVDQNIEARASYEGGWPLAAEAGATCPAIAPVLCDTNSGTINPTCCPSGNTCFGFISPYCCPTTTDCETHVTNIPVCANSTWNMYSQASRSKFFCCQDGQIGVDPLSGYAGVCEPGDQQVPVSLLATMVSQIGGTAVTPFGGFPTTGSQASKTGTTKPATATATTTPNAASPSGTSSSSSSTSNDVSGSVTALKLSLGAIIGIAVGGFFVLVALLSLAVYCCCCRRRRRSRPDVSQEPYKGAYAGQSSTMYGTPQQQQVYNAPQQQQAYGMTEYGNLPAYDSREGGMSPGREPMLGRSEMI